MKRISSIKASYIFIFLLFMFSIDSANGVDIDKASFKGDHKIRDEIGNLNESTDDLNKLIDKNKSKDNYNQKDEYGFFADNKIKEREEKVKLSLDSFLKKYRIKLDKKPHLEPKELLSNDRSDGRENNDNDAVGVKEKKDEDGSNSNIHTDTVSNLILNEENKKIEENGVIVNSDEKTLDEGTSKIKEKDEFDLQKELDLDYKKQMMDLESDTLEASADLEINPLISKNRTVLLIHNSGEKDTEKTSESQIIEKQKDREVIDNKEKPDEKAEKFFKDKEKETKQILSNNFTEILSRVNKTKEEEPETQEKDNEINKLQNLSFINTKSEKDQESLKHRVNGEAEESSAFIEKRIREVLFDKYLDARINLKFLQGAKQLKYFENIKAKISLSQDNLELILNSNPAETEYSLKNFIGDYAKISEEDLTKISFDYRLMDNCEHFVFNKENLGNYKPKNLNSFNNMFLNNEDHEDTINSENNPNYEEKDFENEFLSLHNFNFYLRLDFNFAKIQNKNQRISSLNRLIDSDDNIDNSRSIQRDSELKSFLELRNTQNNNANYNSDGNGGDKTAKEILNVLIKLNFNHKNNNGKIFLDFFDSLNKNEKSVKWVYGRKSSLGRNSNLKSHKNKDSKSTSFLEKEMEAEQAQFSLEDITNNYIKNFLKTHKDSNNSNNSNKRDKDLGFKKREILDDPLDNNEYYIKNLDKNVSEVTVKEKKYFFLKFLNSVIYDSCKEKKAEAEKIKESLRLILKANLDVTNKISKIQNKLTNLETKRLSFTGLFEDSAQMLTEKASIKSLELQQIQYYRNIISKIDKAFVRDSLQMQKDKEKLQKKIEQLEAEKIIYNKTEKNLFAKRSLKENLEFDIAANKQLIIQIQSEALDNKNILAMIENDRIIIQNKLSFRENKIKKNKSALALLRQKIEKLISEKNQTEYLIQKNLAQKQNINESIQKDNSLISEIEQKIKELLAQKSKVLSSIQTKNESLEKIETENLITRNKLVLTTSNLNYLQSSVAEKQKNLENSQKNLLQIRSEFQKISEKRKIFASHIDSLQASIANLTFAEQSLQSQNEALRRELSEIEVNKALGNKRILVLLDEINGIQINLNKFDSNLQANRINKNNYQVNIKNTIDNLVKEKVLDEGKKYYEYLDNLEKESFDGNQIYKVGNIADITDLYINRENKNYNKYDEDNSITQKPFDYFTYKRLKEKMFRELLNNESNKIKGESKLHDKIRVYKATENNKPSISGLNKTLSLEENINSNENLYSELDIEKLRNNKIDSKLIDDYVIIDYDKIFKNIKESTLLNTNGTPNLEARESASDDLIQDKIAKKVNGNNSLTKHYSENIDVLNEEINLNKSEIEKSKIDLKKLKKEFHDTIAKMKQESYANLKILIDLIEIEFKQNSLTNDNFNKINKLIDILK